MILPSGTRANCVSIALIIGSITKVFRPSSLEERKCFARYRSELIVNAIIITIIINYFG